MQQFIFPFMKAALLFVAVLFSTTLFAQSNFVVLKKRSMPIERFYKGSHMQFYTVENYLIEGFVRYCKNDSVFLRLGTVTLVSGGFGTKIDTVYYGFYQVHIKDIVLIPSNNISAASIGNFLFKLGLLAGGIVAGNNINLQPNIRNIVQYTSVVGINIIVAQATLFKRKRVSGYKLGKKYKLHFVNIG